MSVENISTILTRPISRDSKAVVEALGSVNESLGGTSGGSLTPAFSVVSGNGSVASGKRMVGFTWSDDYEGAIAGTTVDSDVKAVAGGITFPAIGSNQYGAIAYTVSAGSLLIITVA